MVLSGHCFRPEKALSFYSDSGGKGNPTEQQEQAVALMEEKLEVVQQLLHGFDYRPYFTADVSQKLSFILQAEDLFLAWMKARSGL